MFSLTWYTQVRRKRPRGDAILGWERHHSLSLTGCQYVHIYSMRMLKFGLTMYLSINQ